MSELPGFLKSLLNRFKVDSAASPTEAGEVVSATEVAEVNGDGRNKEAHKAENNIMKMEAWSLFYKELRDHFSTVESVEKFRKLILGGSTAKVMEADAFKAVVDAFMHALGDNISGTGIVALNLWNPMDQNKFFIRAPEGHDTDTKNLQGIFESNPDNYEYLNRFIFETSCIRPFIIIDFEGNGDFESRLPCRIISGTSKESFRSFLKWVEESCNDPIDYDLEVLAEKISNVYTTARDKLGFKAALILPAQSTFDFSTGGLVFFFKDKIEDHLEKVWTWWLSVSIFQQNFTSLADKEYQRRYALRSALSAIIGRVTAHDLGHMLVNAKLPGAESAAERESYFKHLVEYIRGRTVFTAEASTSNPSWTMSLPFVSQLIFPFSAFSPEGTAREYPSPLVRHIAESEGVTNVKVRVFHACEELSYVRDEEGIWLCKPHDLYVDVPSGPVGSHALYCVLENIIRNGAKYGKSKAEQMTLFMRLDTEGFENDCNLIRVRVWDSHSRYDLSQFLTVCQFFPPLCRPEGFPGDIKSFREGLWEIIDRRGALVSGGWGIKEMRIGAAWLRKKELVEALVEEELIDEEKLTDMRASGTEIEPFLLCPIIVNGCGEKQEVPPPDVQSDPSLYMGYELYMLRLKEVIIVDKELSQIGKEARKRLESVGVTILSDVAEVLKGASRYYSCIIRLPESQEGQDALLETIRRERDDLPSVLCLVTSEGNRVKDRPAASVLITADEYNALAQKLRSPSEKLWPVEILKFYQRWIGEVLKAPTQLSLLLHLNPDTATSAPSAVVKTWAQTAEEFSKHFGGWKMYVHGSEGRFKGSPPEMIIYDYHSTWIGTENPQFYYYESCRKNEPTQIILFNPATSDWVRIRTALSLIEAAVTRVAIIDERIWKHREDAAGPDGTIMKGLEDRNIFLPDSSLIDYMAPTSAQAEQLLPWLREREIKILVIHQGMLDKIFSVRQNVEAWIANVKTVVPFVIVESDRGEGLLMKRPNNARFAPFSSIEPWLRRGGLSKFHLVQTLFASARGKQSS